MILALPSTKRSVHYITRDPLMTDRTNAERQARWQQKHKQEFDRLRQRVQELEAQAAPTPDNVADSAALAAANAANTQLKRRVAALEAENARLRTTMPRRRQAGPAFDTEVAQAAASARDYTEDAEPMRVLWTRGRNMYVSFFASLSAMQQRLGYQALADWCVRELHINLTTCHHVAGILEKADRDRIRLELKRASDHEREQRRRPT
jgi:hypothetical protein